MTQPPGPPDETPDFLAKPVSPSGDQAPPPLPPPASPPAPSYGEPASPYTSPAQPPPAYAPRYAPYGSGYPFAQPHGGATTGLALGIVSVVCSVMALVTCFSIVGALAGPFAVVLGARARKEMEQSPGRYTNPGVATAAFVTGLVGSVLGIAVVGLLVLVFGLFISAAGP